MNHRNDKLTRLPQRLTVAACVILAPTLYATQDIDAAKAIKVKAAYLYQFTKFVEWPKTAFERDKSPIVIAILGNDPFGTVLDKTVFEKTVRGRRIAIVRIGAYGRDSRKTLRSCHLLYVASSERHRIREVLDDIDSQNILVVGEGKDHATSGGMIGLVLDSGRITFHVNHEAVKRAGLRMSAKLLRLAKIVKSRE